MKNKFKARVPNFVDRRGLDLPEFEFETQEELENHEWLSRHKNNATFKCFKYSDMGSFNKMDHPYNYAVMAIYKKEYWVIGFLNNIDNINWKEWRPSAWKKMVS